MRKTKTKKIGWSEKLAEEWHKYKQPSRPSLSEVQIYNTYIKKLPRTSNILVLGSTPEIRDIAATLRIKTAVCDWSKEIYEALQFLMKHRNPTETFYRQDWRTMKLNEKFDMIIGDCATTVVPYKDIDQVFRSIAEHLKPKGIAVQRIWVRHKDQSYSLKEIVRLFKGKPKGMHWYTWMLFPVLLHYYHTQSESLSGEELYEKLEEGYKKGRVPKGLVEFFSLVKNHKTPNNVLLKEDLEKFVRKYFQIMKIEYGKDHFKRNAPIYILKRK